MLSFLLVFISFGFVIISVFCLWIDNCPRRQVHDHHSREHHHHHHYVSFAPIPPPLSYLRLPLNNFQNKQTTNVKQNQPDAESDKGGKGTLLSFAPYTYKTVVDAPTNDVVLDTNIGFVFSVVVLLQSGPFVHDVSQWKQGTLVSKEICGRGTKKLCIHSNDISLYVFQEFPVTNFRWL